jgi:hypothetical protein
MLKKLMLGSVLIAAIAFAGLAGAAREATLGEVYQAAQAGRLAEAQVMMAAVLRNHPDSAKAHFVEAQLLAKQGRLDSAAAELRTAERLAPGLPFAKADAVDALRGRIAATRKAGDDYSRFLAAPAASPSHPPVSMLAMSALVLGAILFFVRASRRRAVPVAGHEPAYAAGGPAPAPAASGTAAPGMGSSLLGGLATGAALGAGMVAGQSLMHRLTDRDETNGGSAAYVPDSGDWKVVPDDMGGSDFGVADGGAWDDAGSGGDWS